MQIAIFGLGKMGSQIARRLHKSGLNVVAWNRSEGPRQEAAKAGVKVFAEVGELIKSIHDQPRIFWLMLPHEIVDEFLQNQLNSHLKREDIIIDGGNSFYKDSIRRAHLFKASGIYYFDCGVSGGVFGEENGFALMLGGDEAKWRNIEPIIKALSSGTNYGLVGQSGAGHFVKMVHNGIEYGMMEAIAEGYAVLQASQFKPDLKLVTKIYQQGSVVRSWLIDLIARIFESDELENTKGEIASSGEGEWTVNAGRELGVDVRVIEAALKVRQESKDPKNQNKFSNKLVALLRKQFGGHSVKK